MTWTVSTNGSKSSTVPTTATFTASGAVISVVNTASSGDMVTFSSATGALPTNFSSTATYFVISTGLTATAIEVATSSGGSALTASGAGSGTITATFEHVLGTDSTNATYLYDVNASNMALGDLTELRIYNEDESSTSYVQTWKGTFQHSQINNEKYAPFVPSDVGIKTTLKQLSGTGRTYNWKLLRQ